MHFGEDTLLSNIRYMDLETYRNQLKQALTKHGTLRPDATVNREIACLHYVFTKTFEREMIETNPFEKGKSLIMKENNQRVRYLTEGEVDRLLDECKERKHLHRIVTCAINTGLRKSDILNLKWDQIRNGFIYPDRVTGTKKRREIPINDDLAAVLKEIRKKQGLTSRYVFTYGRRNISRVDRAFKGALRRAGLRISGSMI